MLFDVFDFVLLIETRLLPESLLMGVEGRSSDSVSFAHLLFTGFMKMHLEVQRLLMVNGSVDDKNRAA